MFSSSPKYATQQYPQHPFTLSTGDTLSHLQTDDQTGLHPLKAQEAQRKYGPNKLEGEGGVQWHKVLLKQVSNAMILVRMAQILLRIDDLPLNTDRYPRSWCSQWRYLMASLITLKAALSRLLSS